jgi:hypothetical protein
MSVSYGLNSNRSEHAERNKICEKKNNVLMTFIITDIRDVGEM